MKTIPEIHESVFLLDDDGEWFPATVTSHASFYATDGTHEYECYLSEEGVQWKPIEPKKVEIVDPLATIRLAYRWLGSATDCGDKFANKTAKDVLKNALHAAGEKV